MDPYKQAQPGYQPYPQGGNYQQSYPPPNYGGNGHPGAYQPQYNQQPGYGYPQQPAPQVVYQERSNDKSNCCLWALLGICCGCCLGEACCD